MGRVAAEPPPSRGGGQEDGRRGAGAAGTAGGDQGAGSPAGPRAQPPRWSLHDWVPGMSLTRKRGFYKQEVNKTAWELPKTYVSPTHIGSGAYGAVW